jgi:hypothetical protein
MELREEKHGIEGGEAWNRGRRTMEFRRRIMELRVNFKPIEKSMDKP